MSQANMSHTDPNYGNTNIFKRKRSDKSRDNFQSQTSQNNTTNAPPQMESNAFSFETLQQSKTNRAARNMQ